jgi:hypothetical protein
MNAGGNQTWEEDSFFQVQNIYGTVINRFTRNKRSDNCEGNFAAILNRLLKSASGKVALQ